MWLAIPGTPIEPSAAIAAAGTQTAGWTASGSTWGSEGHDPAHEVRPANREHAGECSAAALPDQERLLTLLVAEPLEALLQPPDRSL